MEIKKRSVSLPTINSKVSRRLMANKKDVEEKSLNELLVDVAEKLETLINISTENFQWLRSILETLEKQNELMTTIEVEEPKRSLFGRKKDKVIDEDFSKEVSDKVEKVEKWED
jgi:hypothetical protein